MSLLVWPARKVSASARLQGPQPGLTHTLRPAELSKAGERALEADDLDASEPSDNEVSSRHTSGGATEPGLSQAWGKVLS